MRILLAFVAMALSCSTAFAADPACSSDALERAQKLLAFHSGGDERASVEKTVTPLPSIRNPEDPKQRFAVLQVWGYIYKGKYRMRFIYYNSPVTRCVLMGQEILEMARL